MPTRSQRHMQEIQGVNADGEQANWLNPSITISALSPNTRANGVSGTIMITGTGFKSTDLVTYRGVDYGLSSFTNSTQITSVAIPAGTAGTFPVTVKRANGSKVSNASNLVVT